MVKAKELLVAVAAKNNGDWNKTIKFIRAKEKPTGEEIEKFSPLADQAITILDENYPETWKNSYMPPIVLFYKGGEKSLLSKINRSAIFVVDDGKGPQVKKIIDDLLEHGGLIVKPDLDSGHLLIMDKEQTLILSEYPCGDYDMESKEQRTRVAQIGAGLCGKLFIGATRENSIVTASVITALNSGGDVYAIPMHLGTTYKNNEFIREGANIVLEWSDVMDETKKEEE